MRLLGIIKKIDGKPRTWTNANGETVYSFRMAFEAEGNQFLGEYTIAPQRLAQLGIRPGAVGYLDIKFSIRDYTSKTTGEAVSVQDIRFSKWSLANANQPAEAPANAPEPSAEEVAAAMAEAEQAREQAQEANLDPSKVTF
jgi:hypothetical protein